MNEMWADIKGVQGYQCSSHGQIRSIDRSVIHTRTGVANRKGKLLKLLVDSAGYVRIRLKQAKITPLVHRIVAITFIANPLNKPWVNHKDGNKQNNNASNLEWSTIRENVQHAYDNNLNWAKKGESSPSAKLNINDVAEIRRLSSVGEKRKDLAVKYGVTPECISRIVLNKTWKLTIDV